MARADASEADKLFHEGRELLKQGRLEEACGKLAESEKLDSSSGTLMNLAYCHEQLGKFASAFAEFSQAARLAATQQATQRVAEAQRRADALLPRLSYLVVRVKNPVPLLEVEHAGVKLDPASFNTPVPVDPGPQAIRATAPGYAEWSLVFTVSQPGQLLVEVPQLGPDPSEARKLFAPAALPTETDAAQNHHTTSRGQTGSSAAGQDKSLPLSFWATAGVGVLAAGAAATSGLMSLTSYHDAARLCPTHKECSDEAMTARHRAGTEATIADVALATAVVAVGAGIYLYATSRQAGKGASVSTASSLIWAW